MKDLYKRNINYLRISLTQACNYRCDYCMPRSKLSTVECGTALREDKLLRMVKAFTDLGVTKVRLSGGEPLIYPALLHFIRSLCRISALDQVALTTNGYYLEDMACSLKEAGLSRINVSLDTLDPLKYEKITCGGSLQKVFRGLEAAKNQGFEKIKLNCVLMKGVNDHEISALVDFACNEDFEIRFIEMMPIGVSVSLFERRFLAVERIHELYPGLEKTGSPAGSAAEHFVLPSTGQRIGLISPMSRHFCSDCNRLRLDSRGRLRLCLFGDVLYDLLPYTDDTVLLKEKIGCAILEKPFSHTRECLQNSCMYTIGG